MNVECLSEILKPIYPKKERRRDYGRLNSLTTWVNFLPSVHASLSLQRGDMTPIVRACPAIVPVSYHGLQLLFNST